jgi:hypothetical protein
MRPCRPSARTSAVTAASCPRAGSQRTHPAGQDRPSSHGRRSDQAAVQSGERRRRRLSREHSCRKPRERRPREPRLLAGTRDVVYARDTRPPACRVVRVELHPRRCAPRIAAPREPRGCLGQPFASVTHVPGQKCYPCPRLHREQVHRVSGSDHGGWLRLSGAADLIPELQHDRSLRALFLQSSMISLGIAVMGLLALVE